MLHEARSGQCAIPATRFNVDGFYNPSTEVQGTIHCRGGHFLEADPRQFDNAFFGLSNLEAMYMDPQQRQLLEVVYECFESAGITLQELSGANVGCYIANFTPDFYAIQSKDSDSLHHYSATGSTSTILSNRISYIFNLKGPSLTLDTACSSSITALHMANVALRNHECEAAIVASANLIQSPELFIAAVKAGIISADAQCHTFDTSANGYARAEGVNAIFLKRLDDAVENYDPVRAVVRGTAINRCVKAFHWDGKQPKHPPSLLFESQVT